MNLRPSGYEPDELPDCSTPRQGTFVQWMEKDSNLRSRRQQIYSLPPLATRESIHISCFHEINGAYRARTYDPLLVRQMLSQLS